MQASSIVQVILATLQQLAPPVQLYVAATAHTPGATAVRPTAAPAAACIPVSCDLQTLSSKQVQQQIGGSCKGDPSTPRAPVGPAWSQSPNTAHGSSNPRKGVSSSESPVVLKSLLRTVQQELLAERDMLKHLAEENEVLRHKLAAADDMTAGRDAVEEVRKDVLTDCSVCNAFLSSKAARVTCTACKSFCLY